MKKKFPLLWLIVAMFHLPLASFAVDYTMRQGTATGGIFLSTVADNWSTDGGVSGLAVVPTVTAADNITVPVGVTIVWNASITVGTLTVDGTANFTGSIYRVGKWTNLSAVVTDINTTGLVVGMKVRTGSGITGGQTIASIDGPTQLTLSANATSSNSSGIGAIAFVPSTASLVITAYQVTVNSLAGAATGSIGTTTQSSNIRFTTDASYSYAGTTQGNCLGFVPTAPDAVGGSIKLTQNAAMNNVSFMNGSAAAAFPATSTTISTSGVLTLAAANSAIQVGTMIYTTATGAPFHGMFVTALLSATTFQLNVNPTSLITAGASNLHYTNNYIDLNGFQLTVSGNIHGNTTSPSVANVSGAGFFKGNSSSTLIIASNVQVVTNYSLTLAPGTYGTVTINTNNAVTSSLPLRPAGTGSMVTINNFNVGGLCNIAGGSAFTLGTGAMVISPGARLTIPSPSIVDFNNRPVTLQASATATAAMNITGTINNATNVTVQQWITGQRGFRVLSNPFASTLTPSTIGTANGITITGSNDVKTYNNGFNTWSGSIATISARQPYAVFIRGLASEVTGLSYSAGPTAFAYGVTGTLGGTSVGITPFATGFTLVGNPHTGPINSQALTGATPGAYYVYNTTQGFTDARVKSGGWTTSLTSGTTTPVPMMGVIAYEAGSSTEFFVTTSSLNFSNPSTVGLFSDENQSIKNIEIHLLKDGHFHDNVFIREEATGSDLGNEKLDLRKFKNENSNIYCISSDNTKLGIDTRKNVSNIPIGISAEKGKYSFSFLNNNLSNATSIYLSDKWLGTKTLVEKGAVYSFEITDDILSQGDKRFEIQGTVASAISEPITNDLFEVKIFGNIVNNLVNVQIKNARASSTVTVSDINGKIVSNVVSVNGLNKISVLGGSGLYFIKVSDGQSTSIHKVVKL